MQKNIHRQAKKYLRSHKRWKKWQKIVTTLSCIVVFCTVYALILPAITARSETSCGYEEHKHSESCYEKTLICTTPTEVVEHKHVEACVTYEKNIICGQIEQEGHTHDVNCYTEEQELICGMEEVASHTHEDACYEETSVYVCGVEEGQKTGGHEHVDACYSSAKKCTTEEHEHTTACFSNPDADVETEEIWKRTFKNVKLTGDWSEDLIAIAESQLGYLESTENYIIEEDGETKQGYTRYGDWYGNAYGDWCAMFVSFCLNYAEVDNIPFEASCQNWINKLSKEPYESYRDADEYTPVRGDLIFFNWNKSPESDHVGIVVEYIEATENETAKVKTIEGNASHTVKYKTYDADADTIMGYGQLPEEPDKELVEIVQENDLFVAKATFEQGVLPEDAVMDVEVLAEDTQEEVLRNHIQENGQELLESQQMKVDFSEKSGEIVEPNGDVRFKIEFKSPLEVDTAQTFAEEEETEEVSTQWILYRMSETESVDEVAGEEVSLTEVEETNALKAAAFAYEPAAAYAVAAVAADAQTVANFDQLKNKIAANTTDVIDLRLIESFPATEKITIGNGKTVVIDLAGQTLAAQVDTVFEINGGKLTIVNSEEPDEIVTSVETGAAWANVAEYEKEILTYYVTESVKTNGSTGATEETVVQHTVELNGKITGAGGPIVDVVSGEFTLQSGALVGSSNRAVRQKAGVVTLEGGYICGNKTDGNHGDEDVANGGAVSTTAGTLNVSGTVIAANTATGRGGAIEARGDKAVLSITGGIISGNQSTTAADSKENGTHYGGGGVYCDGGAQVTMSGGYITNNTAAAIGYFDGGGGVLIDGTGTIFTLTGGYITGNEATSGGGIRTDWRSSSTVYINKEGYICSNYARKAEGGGVCINMEGSAWIEGGFINNNRTDTPNHWGGGGVFCSNGSKIFMRNVLITENNADGFGGGVAGCSTGRVYVTVKEGGAIYDNSATGMNMSGDGSTKPEDHALGKDNPIFMQYGFEDYFCALNSMVEGTMLGGHGAEWKGSADGEPVTAGKGEVLVASSVMGLTAYPEAEGKIAAQDLAQLYVNGNYSYTHGGGVLANGYLIIGEVEHIYVHARLQLSGTKEYYSEKSEAIPMENGEFTFAVVDENTGAVITTGTNDEDGNIIFKDRIPFRQKGTYTYLVKEMPVEDSSVTIDTSLYRITVNVEVEETTWLETPDGIIKRYQHLIDSIKVEKNTGTEWKLVSETKPENHEDGPIKLTLTGDATFTNYKLESTNIKVVKHWTGNETHPNSVTVGLYQNGELYGEKVTLNESNGWSAVWENMPLGKDDNAYTYEVIEDPIAGFRPQYDFYSTVSSTGYWIPASEIIIGNKYIVVSPKGNYLFQVTDKHKDDRISDADKALITKGTGQITIGGKVYRDYYTMDQISDRSIYTATYGFTNNKDLDGTYLLSKSISSAILVEPNGNANILKGGTGISGGYYSLFSYSQNGLVGRKGWGDNRNAEYRVIYSNNQFSAEDAEADYNSETAAKLYTYAEAPVSKKEYVYVITNVRDESITYGLDITKISSDDANVRLSDAHFNLKNADGDVLHFIQTSSTGAYTWSAAKIEGITTTKLVTANKGKLVLKGLPAGTYTLVETDAPVGYKEAEPQEVVLGADSSNPTLKIDVVDPREDEFIMPETGGIGTNKFTIGGLLLMMSSLLLGVTVKRQRERRMR